MWNNPYAFAFYNACTSGDREEVVRLLRNPDCDVNAPFESDQAETPLIRSIRYGHTYLALDLLRYGADVNKPMKNGRTPLMTAAGAGSYLITRELIMRGADVNAKSVEGTTALMYAIAKRRDACCVYLLMKKADVNQKDDDGWTVFNYAEQKGIECYFRNLLMQSDATVTVFNQWYQCAKRGDFNLVDTGFPLVVSLAKHGLVCELISVIQDGGVSPDTVNHAGSSALNFACKYCHFDCVHALLVLGANVNMMSRGGRTPLMMAVKYDITGDIVERLMNSGADPDIVSSYDGWTAWNFLEQRTDPAKGRIAALLQSRLNI